MSKCHDNRNFHLLGIIIEAVVHKSISYTTSVVGFEALRDPDDQLEASQEVGIPGMEGMVTLILAYN